MKCFFYGNSIPGKEQSGIISFVIPDFGLSFKTVWSGDALECQYLGILSLLRFIEVNIKNFSGETIEIYSDSSGVINCFKSYDYPESRYEKLNSSLIEYYQKIEFSLHWVPLIENKAFKGICNYPPNSKFPRKNFTLPEGLDA
jgi:hypothetical protein